MSLPAAYLAEFSEPRGYLDFAGTGPPSRKVVEAVSGALERVHEAEEDPWRVVEASLEEARGRAARLLGTGAEAVAVVPNTSYGLFAVAFGLGAGNVVVPVDDFPANLYPWVRAAQRGGPEVRLLETPDGRLAGTRVAEAVDRQTVAVAVCLVHYLSGFRVDLAEVREAAGTALLVVDAMQGLGALEMSLEPADVMVAGGHKWLRAGWGAGLAAFSEAALERLQPAFAGWYGVEDHMDFILPVPHPPRRSAERLHMGSPAAFGGPALAAALEVLELAGIASIEAALLERVLELEDALLGRGAELLAPRREPSERAGILSFRLPDEPSSETAARLGSAGLVVSDRSGWVRLSPHATTPSGLAELVDEVLA